MSTRRYRHFNPAQVLHARGAWDARRTGLADGRMASWPSLPGSAMAGPTQIAADSTRPVLVNGVRAYAQFQSSEQRRLQWLGATELATFQNQPTGVIISAIETGAATGVDQPVVFFSTNTAGTGTRFYNAASVAVTGPGAGGRRLDADSPFAGAAVGSARSSGLRCAVDARADWASGAVSAVVQDGIYGSASTAYPSGAGNSQNAASIAASVGGSPSIYFNGRIYAFAILRPTSPISGFDAVLRRIQQSYCVSFGIPYRS